MRRAWILTLSLMTAACSGGADPLAELKELPPPPRPAAEPRPLPDLSDGLDLDEAVALALRQNPRFQVSRLETALAEARKRIAGTYPHNPELGLEGGRAVSSDVADDYSARVSLSHTFELGGKRGYRMAAADADVDRSRHDVENDRRLLRARVSARFFEVLYLRQREALSAQNLALARKFLEVANARLGARQVAEIEVNTVKLDSGRAAARKERAARESRIARAHLAALLGSAGRSEFEVKGELGAIVVIPDRERLVRAALDRRPDLRAARARLRTMEERVNLAASLAVPDLHAGIFAEYETLRLDTSPGTISDRDTIVGIDLTLPLPVLNTRKGERLEAEIERRRAEYEIEARTQEIRRDVELGVARLESARTVVESYERELNRLAQQNADDIQKAYQAGEVGTLQILRAQEDLNLVQEQYLQAQVGLRLALTEIEAAVGMELSEVK